MSEPNDLPPEPSDVLPESIRVYPVYHYNEEEDPPAQPDPGEPDNIEAEAQKAIDLMVGRTARELVKHPNPLMRAAAVYHLAPHEVPFLLGDPEPAVRLAAARVCAAFPLLRVLLIDLKLQRRDPSAQVREEVRAMLVQGVEHTRYKQSDWAIEALMDSPLYERYDVTDMRGLPSGSARERGDSASWARREILDRPVEEVVPCPKLSDSSEGAKKVAHVYDASYRGWHSVSPSTQPDQQETLEEILRKLSSEDESNEDESNGTETGTSLEMEPT